jgi:hypothetical protein
MVSKSTVEAADRLSRKRAWVVAVAALAFVVVQLIVRPFPNAPQRSTEVWTWTANAAALLLMLAVGGGWLSRRAVRELANDEVYRSHNRRAVSVGYWVAMAVAMGVWLLAGDRSMSARQAIYLVVTPSVAVALLTLSYLEHRAHRDG